MSESLFDSLKRILYPHLCVHFKNIPSIGKKVCTECGELTKMDKEQK
jgi:hypothetical protein